MIDVPTESVGELVSLLTTALLSGALTVVGLLIERAGVHELLVGHTVLGAWELVMGGIPLFVGLYLIGYQRLWQRLAASR